MKKIMVMAGIGIGIIVAISCGSNPRNNTTNPAQDSLPVTSQSKTSATQDNVANPRAMTNDSTVVQGAVLVANDNCKTCHAIDKKMTGPSYNQVADKYENSAGMQAELAHKIITGGYGRWGTVVMPAHSNISESDATQMAKYILSLKSK